MNATEQSLKAITCPICGVTAEETNSWHGCRKHGRVCMSCCSKCKDFRSFSGIHWCLYETEEMKLDKEIERRKLKITRANYLRGVAEQRGDKMQAEMQKLRIRDLEEEINVLIRKKEKAAQRDI